MIPGPPDLRPRSAPRRSACGLPSGHLVLALCRLPGPGSGTRLLPPGPRVCTPRPGQVLITAQGVSHSALHPASAVRPEIYQYLFSSSYFTLYYFLKKRLWAGECGRPGAAAGEEGLRRGRGCPVPASSLRQASLPQAGTAGALKVALARPPWWGTRRGAEGAASSAPGAPPALPWDLPPAAPRGVAGSAAGPAGGVSRVCRRPGDSEEVGRKPVRGCGRPLPHPPPPAAPGAPASCSAALPPPAERPRGRGTHRAAGREGAGRAARSCRLHPQAPVSAPLCGCPRWAVTLR